MNWVDREIEKAGAAGLFRDLPGAGKPIPDLSDDPGWWAKRRLDHMRHEDTAALLARRIDRILDRLPFLASPAEVEAALERIERVIERHNARAPLAGQVPTIDRSAHLARWRRAHPFSR